jgi:glycosyltransferase involved in cell wall biosynthesis
VLALTVETVTSDRRGGGTKRTWNLLRGLEREGISTSGWAIGVEPLPESAQASLGEVGPVRSFPSRARRTVVEKVRALISPLPEEVWRRPVEEGDWTAELVDFDLVVLMAPHTAQVARHLERARMPFVVDMRDAVDVALGRISMTIPGRMARYRMRLDSRKWTLYERWLLPRAALVVAVSEEDALALRPLSGTTRVAVHPNGVDVASYRFRDHSTAAGGGLLMTGHFGYAPNIDATRWLSKEIMPMLRQVKAGLRLTLAGRNLARDGWPEFISAAPNVPDIRPYFDAADALIVPLRAGGGTRLKLLEAFAKGLPAVTTTIGCEGLPVEDGVHALIADSTDQIVTATIRLLDDVPLRARLAANARRLVEQQFDWREISARYAADLRSVARGR